MSFQDDRNDQASSGSSSLMKSSTTNEKGKPAEKSKVIAGVSTPQSSEVSQPIPRQSMDAQKASKPLQNRPIAPAAAAGPTMMPIGTTMGAGYLPPTIASYGHHMIPGYSMMRPQMGPIPPQHSFPHVPYGATAAALSASTHPKNIAQIRGTTMSTASKIPGIPSLLPGQASSITPQPHSSTNIATTTSRPSSPSNQLTSATGSFHQQGPDYKQSEGRDRGSPHVPDIARKTSSPHCSSPTIPNASNLLTNAKTSLPAAPMHKPGQPLMLPHYAQGTHPLAGLQQQVAPAPGIPAVCLNQNQPKPSLPVATLGKMYPAHLSLVPGRPGIGQSDSPSSPDISRLGVKPSTPASPVTIQQHSTTSTVSSSTHLIAASTSLPTSGVVDGRVERPPHPGASLPNTMMPNPLYPQYVISEPGHGYPFPFSHQGFPQPLPSGIRPTHTQTTPAMPGMRILDQQSFFAANNALMNLGAGNLTPESLGSVAIMDGSTANPASIYSMQLGMQQAPNLQVAVSSSNPNATSPRPSILRKRTSEGIRKPAIVPYNNDVPAPVTSEPTASPRSESTLSAPQSGQSSPKPLSDAGNQSDQPSQQTIVTTTTTSPIVTSSQPLPSPLTIKKESSEPTVTTVVSTDSTPIAAATSSMVEKPVPITPVLPDGASPRKKPRKQNVVATEDKYGSSVPLEEGASSEEDDKKPKPPVEETMDDDLKFILNKRPKISIFGGYKVNTKAAHNHFLKYSDVRIKEERKPTVQDIANQKGILHRVSGWRVHHVAAQMDDLSSVEQQVLQKLFEFRENLPKPRPGQKTKYHDELIMLDELVQGNIQRSQLVAEQLADIRKGMVKVLDHRPRCVEVLQKYMNKRNPKKKS